MINIVVKSGLALHEILVETVMNAPMELFAEVDSGVILNRFSQDMTLVDAVLPTVTFGTVLGNYIRRICFFSTLFTIYGATSIQSANSPCEQSRCCTMFDPDCFDIIRLKLHGNHHCPNACRPVYGTESIPTNISTNTIPRFGSEESAVYAFCGNANRSDDNSWIRLAVTFY